MEDTNKSQPSFEAFKARFSDAVQTAKAGQRTGFRNLVPGKKPTKASQETTAKVAVSPWTKASVAQVGDRFGNISHHRQDVGLQKGGPPEKAPPSLKRSSKRIAGFFPRIRPSLSPRLGRSTSPAESSAPTEATPPSTLRARTETITRGATRARARIRDTFQRGTQFASNLQARLLTQTDSESYIKIKDAPKEFQQLAKALRPVEKASVKAGMKTWGKDNQWGKASPPNIESQRLRGSGEDAKQTHDVGGGVRVSHQVDLDFGRPMDVSVGGPSGGSAEFRSEGYGKEGNEWNPDGNKALDVFQSIEKEIKSSPQAEGMDDDQIQELVHTVMDGACQTFDSVLSNPFNAVLSPTGELADLNGMLRSGGGTPKLKVHVREDKIVVSREQPMELTLIELRAAVPVEMSRSFEIDIKTGECKQVSAEVEIQWNQGTST